VLSLEEAVRVHTLDRFNYRWQRADGGSVSDKTIREVIGESIPPAGFAIIVQHLTGLLDGASVGAANYCEAGPLFSALSQR
jgi:DNA (cytosine-5)-methyltransferase 1